jgi:hypothetical protein
MFDFINSLLGSSGDFGWVGAVVMALLTLGLGPAVIMLCFRVLALPGFRQICYGPCFAAGKIASVTMTRWLGVKGESLEGVIQEFLVYLLSGFFKGLDHDDLVAKGKSLNLNGGADGKAQSK